MAWRFLAMGHCSLLLSSPMGSGLGCVSAGFSVKQLLAGGGGGLATHFTSPRVAPRGHSWRCLH